MQTKYLEVNETNHIDKSLDFRSKESFQKLIFHLEKIVGTTNIKIDLDERLHYSRSTLVKGTIPSAIVYPTNKEEIANIMKLANFFQTPVHPVSSGKNWGYSDANAITDGQILLDLRRLNRILEVNAKLGYMTIEPGVTQGQIYQYLEEHNLPLWMDATGAGPDTSVIGNTMDRGFGHSPYGDRFAHSCGYEVVLPNGNVIQTGFGRFENSQVTQIYKWGVGPSLDGLFTQSNLGIVTKMTFWLMPKPQEFSVAYFVLKKAEDICEFMDRVAILRLEGTLKSVIHIGNDLRTVSMSRSYPFQTKPSGDALNMTERSALVREQGVGFWAGTAGFYGTKEQIHADTKRLKQALKGFKGLKMLLVMSEKRLALCEKLKPIFNLAKPLHRFTTMLEKARLAFDLLKGNSPKNCVQGGLWRVKNPIKTDSTDPLDYQAGFYWISPVLPMQGQYIRKLITMVEPIFHKYDFDLQQTLSMTTERALTSVMTISFDKKNEIEAYKAKLCHDEVVKTLLEAGFILYRAGNHTMQKVSDASNSNYEELLTKIKKAFDPNSILSPGKYIK